jgi:aerobic carbon-monoxide dehydrogenase medium subunit
VTVSTYFQPTSVPEALALLGEHGPDLLVIAGGTVAMPLINEGISLPRLVMGLRHAGIDGIDRTGDTLRIGAMTTLTAAAEQTDSPLLATAARKTAAWAIRNMATVGGNLFTPPPGGDVATALLALDANVEVAGPSGTRQIPLATFWTGFLGTALAADELVTAIIVTLTPGEDAFLKFGRKEANTPAVVTVAAHLDVTDGIVRGARVALGAVGPHPLRAPSVEAALAGAPLTPDTINKAAAAAVDDVAPFTDAVATDWYRRRMVGVIVERALTGLAAQAGRNA